MRTVQFELMRPEEFLEARAAFPVAYLPLGPLEWHGPHMPFGTDGLDAQAIARSTAERIGGVVFPTLFCGTECARNAQTLQRMGFEDENLYVVGMDVPDNSVPSCYFPEEAYGMILKEHLRVMQRLGFKLIVVVNAHGADGQLASGARIARELTQEGRGAILFLHAFQPLDAQDESLGHANISETSMQMYLNPDCVRLSALPGRDVKLATYKYGIADSLLFKGRGNPEHTVEHDPRDATAERGQRYIERDVQYTIEQTLKAYNAL